jgi:hypothetical protein
MRDGAGVGGVRNAEAGAGEGRRWRIIVMFSPLRIALGPRTRRELKPGG